MKKTRNSSLLRLLLNRGLYILLIPLLLAALACEMPSFGGATDDSLKETQAALAIQSTFDAERAATLDARQTETAKKASESTATPGDAQPTEAPSQDAPNATETPAAGETPVPPSEPPTSTPAAAEPVLLEDWKVFGAAQTSSGCFSDGSGTCWSGEADGMGHDMVLLAETPMMIDSAWSNPHLVFWHKISLGEGLYASVEIQASGVWKTLTTFSSSAVDWQKISVDLSSYKGQEVTIRFFAKAGKSKMVMRSGWQTELPGPTSTWRLQDIQIQPDFQP